MNDTDFHIFPDKKQKMPETFREIMMAEFVKVEIGIVEIPYHETKQALHAWRKKIEEGKQKDGSE